MSVSSLWLYVDGFCNTVHHSTGNITLSARNRSVFCSVTGLRFEFMTMVLRGQLSNSEITYVTFF